MHTIFADEQSTYRPAHLATWDARLDQVNVLALHLAITHLASVCIQANVCRGESNLSARVAHDLLIVDFGRGRNLAKDHDHIGLRGRFAGHLRAAAE